MFSLRRNVAGRKPPAPPGGPKSISCELPMSPDEAARMIRDMVAPPGKGWAWRTFTTGMKGKVIGHTLELYWHRGAWRNSFRPFFFGRILSIPGGSVIIGRFGLHPFVKMLMRAWFGLLALFAVLTPPRRYTRAPRRERAPTALSNTDTGGAAGAHAVARAAAAKRRPPFRNVRCETK